MDAVAARSRFFDPTVGGHLAHAELAHVINALRFSGMAIIPSDTCFALAVDARDTRAVGTLRKVLDMEGAALSVAFPTLETFERYAHLGTLGMRLAYELCPGPLTIAAPMTSWGTEQVDDNLIGDGTIGGRISDSSIEAQIGRAFGHPLTTTAIRDDRGEPVRNRFDAYDVVEAGLNRVASELSYLPLLTAVATGRFQHEKVSTVVTLRTSTQRLDFVRDGVLPRRDVYAATRKMSAWEIEDWT